MQKKSIAGRIIEKLDALLGQERPPVVLEPILEQLEMELSYEIGCGVKRIFDTSREDPYVELYEDDKDITVDWPLALCRIYFTHRGEKPKGSARTGYCKELVEIALRDYAKALESDAYIINGKAVFQIS